MVTKITFFYNPVASYILFVNVLDVLGFLENISEKIASHFRCVGCACVPKGLLTCPYVSLTLARRPGGEQHSFNKSHGKPNQITYVSMDSIS